MHGNHIPMTDSPTNTRQTIIAFTTQDYPLVDRAGGKALALMQMTAAGMPVPPGFVLTVAFFEAWTARLQATPEWAAISITDAGSIGPLAKALQAACQALRFTERQRDELYGALKAYREQHPGRLFAVRSSSPEEDMEGASFAGGYETMLGVTVEGIEAAILQAFTSSFDERVFLYKREHGFKLDQPRIAVIVQQQVDADSAGVAFSLNPLNNCFDEAVINANHGLGESVVSGDADPDVFVVDKLKCMILETRIGAKQVVVSLDAKGGSTRSARAKQTEAAITPAQALELTRLLDTVEAYYKKPVDIEWAISDGRLFLLQARPITTYRPLPDEMLTAPGQPKRLYANSTLIEQGLQDPLSVLGTDFLGYVLDKVGGPVAEGAIGSDGITFTAGGGYFMNLSFATMLGMRNASLAPGSFGDPRVLEILDHIDMKQYLGGQLPAKLKALRGKMMFSMPPMLASALGAYLRPERILAKYKAALPNEIRRLEAVTGDGLSLRAQALALTELLRFFYGEHGIPMILAGQFAERRIRGLFKQDAAQAADHLINLGIALPGNKTAKMGEAMYDLATSAEIGRYDSAGTFLTDLNAGRLSPEFSAAWAKYMSEFGMRCPTEIDAATPRPSEQPALLFEQLKSMALAVQGRDSSRPFFEEARARREASYQALLAIARKSSKRKARALEGYYRTWLLLGGYRETPKHYVITVIDLFRGRALGIARAFVSAGRLDTPAQIFDLCIADIDRATADPSLDLRALARQRTALTHKIRKNKQVVRIIDSRGRIFFPPRKASAPGELIGVPISPGVVQGRVKIFQHATDKKLLPGEILVARATDPGWTPLFIDARGIILEIGGALQHGAVVAREYGVPCVSGVDDATSRLKDGQLVEVDGSNGVVRLVEQAKNTKRT
jgi:pyruvate,water dikinase